MYAYVSSLPLQGVTSAKVQIRFVADEDAEEDTWLLDGGINELVDISQLVTYHTFIEPGREAQWQSGVRVIYTTDATVRDFRLISIIHSFQLYEMCCEVPCFCTFIEDVLFSLDELTPEMPLVTAFVHTGCFTSGRGISFSYGGATRYFNIVLSNKSSHLFLTWIFMLIWYP